MALGEVTEARLLELIRLERALARADVARPGYLLPREWERLRYLLGFARLTRFEPGAADRGGAARREEVDVTERVEPLRESVVETLAGLVRSGRDPRERLAEALAAAKALAPEVAGLRARILTEHAGALRENELDAEAGHPRLASVAGGGGGAGFVNVGAYEVLERAGIVPHYVIGASIGALLGLFRARRRVGEWLAYADLAARLESAQVFSPPSLGRRYGLQGLLRLRLRKALGPLFTRPDGALATIADLDIPYESVVAGIRRRSFDLLPRSLFEPAPGQGGEFGRRMWQLAAFFDPRVVKPIVLGADPRTAAFGAIDAAGFSAAIPGVLHYDLDAEDDGPAAILDGVMADEDVAAIVDGGVVANVPAELAWQSVQRGKLGTRNVVFLAFDCFHPQWDPAHLWLQPITQAVALQMARSRRFAHWVVRFEPTLSPLNVTPNARAVDDAIGWGRDAMERELPVVRRLLEPVAWRPLS